MWDGLEGGGEVEPEEAEEPAAAAGPAPSQQPAGAPQSRRRTQRRRDPGLRPASELDWLGPLAAEVVPMLEHLAATCPPRAHPVRLLAEWARFIQDWARACGGPFGVLATPEGVARLLRALQRAAEQLAAVRPGDRVQITIAQTTLAGADGEWVDLETRGGRPTPSQANRRVEDEVVVSRVGPVACITWNIVCFPTQVPPGQHCPAPAPAAA